MPGVPRGSPWPPERALRARGAVTQACLSLLTPSLVGTLSHCVENSYRQRQTALFTDICQPLSQAGSWVSVGRRRPVSGDGATPEGQALFTHSSSGRRLPGILCLRAGGGGGGAALLTRCPPATFLSPPSPFPSPSPLSLPSVSPPSLLPADGRMPFLVPNTR